MTREVVVVGGGISGLAVAWSLQRANVDVALLEANPQVGGAMQTERRDGFLLEKGPFNVIVRDPAFEEMLDAVSARVRVVTASDAAKNRYVYRRGQIHAVPTNPVRLFTSPLLSTGGALRAVRGLFWSARSRSDEVTIEAFATRRFGREVADTLVSAVIAGILAGDISKLSAYAAFPVLRDFDQRSFSPLFRTLRRVPTMLRKRRDPTQQRRWKGLVSIDQGLGGLAAAIAADLGDRSVTNTPIVRITSDADGYALHDQRGGVHRSKQVVLATPVSEAANLLRPLAPRGVALLDTISSTGLVVINLGFKRTDIAHPLDGFGFLVPRNEPDFPLMGVLFADSAFPHHAPPDQRLLRVFIGGVRTPSATAMSDGELVEVARAALERVLGVTGEPTLVDICRWPAALPQFHLGHVRKVAELRATLASEAPHLHLAGNYLDGVSISDCAKYGKALAQSLADDGVSRA